MSTDYGQFIARKAVKAASVGFEPKTLNPHLFDWQALIVRWALRKGRAAKGLEVASFDGFRKLTGKAAGARVVTGGSRPADLPRGPVPTPENVMTSRTQPAIFVSHGSPMIALERSPAALFLDRLGPVIEATFGRPRAVLVVSPHSSTRAPFTPRPSACSASRRSMTRGTLPASSTLRFSGKRVSRSVILRLAVATGVEFRFGCPADYDLAALRRRFDHVVAMDSLIHYGMGDAVCATARHRDGVFFTPGAPAGPDRLDATHA